MTNGHPGTDAAARLWGQPAVARALADAVEDLATTSGIDPELAEAVLLDALRQHLHGQATAAVQRARAHELTWPQIAEAFDQSTSTVRHRFDPQTIERRRESVDRRRREGRLRP